MYKGKVTFETMIRGDGLLLFDQLEFRSNEPGVEKVEIEGKDGDKIYS